MLGQCLAFFMEGMFPIRLRKNHFKHTLHEYNSQLVDNYNLPTITISEDGYCWCRNDDCYTCEKAQIVLVSIIYIVFGARIVPCNNKFDKTSPTNGMNTKNIATGAIDTSIIGVVI